MSWVTITQGNFAVNKAARSQDMLEIINNQIAVKEFPKRVPFGGDSNFQYVNTTYQSTVDGVVVQIDGTNIGGLTFELHFMALVQAGDTAYAQLWNRSTSSQVVEKSTQTQQLALVASTTFTLPTGSNMFEIRVKNALGGSYPFKLYNFELVQR